MKNVYGLSYICNNNIMVKVTVYGQYNYIAGYV